MSLKSSFGTKRLTPKKTSALALTIIITMIVACQSATPAAQPSAVSPASAEPARAESQTPSSGSNVAQDIPVQEASSNRIAPKLDTPEEPDNLVDSTWPTSPTKAKVSSASAQVDQPSAPAPAVASEPLPTSTPLPQSVEPAPTATRQSTPELVAMPTQEPTPAPQIVFGNDIDETAHPFMLPSALGQEYSLESFRGDKNVVLVFYRAFW